MLRHVFLSENPMELSRQTLSQKRAYNIIVTISSICQIAAQHVHAKNIFKTWKTVKQLVSDTFPCYIIMC